MTTGSFTVKQLQGSITINPSSSTPTFEGSNSNTVTFGGPGDAAVRIHAEVHNAGGIDGELSLSVYGLPLSVMNKLSTFGQQLNLLPRNKITLLAGDGTAPLSEVYTGSIITSIIDFHQPEVGMSIKANVATAFSAGVAPPASYNGQIDVATAMKTVADQMGLQFENNGVSSQLANTYLYGSARDQYNTIREHADISATIDRGILAIWPKFKNRTGQVATLSPLDNSLIDYPAYTAYGIMLRALYNPVFSIGKQVIVKDSEVTPANKTWNIYSINHLLDSQTDNGKWESVLFGTAENFPTPLTQQ